MFPFESGLSVSSQKQNSSAEVFLLQVFAKPSLMAPMEANLKVSNRENVDRPVQSIDAFGAIAHMDLPSGFNLENKTAKIGAIDDRIYSDGSGDAIISVARLHAPVVMPGGEVKLKTLLSNKPGTLTDAQRSEATEFLAKFGDNQYKPGNSLSGYGSDWSAPNYFIRTMEVREIDGKKVLFVDGANTPSPWKVDTGLNQAIKRFSAAFMLGADGSVQTVYLEAKPSEYNRYENSFVYAVKNAKLN